MAEFEGQSPQYSAFAIVAIESIWPNSEGGELGPDSYDLDFLQDDGSSAQLGPNQGKLRRRFFRGGTGTGFDRDNALYKNSGYYKIIPLNVLSVGTRTNSKEGSSFTVQFTLDELLLVTEEQTKETILKGATGLPVKSWDITDEAPGTLPVWVGNGEWRYVKDEELGLARFRVSGASSLFSVEDIVEVNDTVTIWLYHDPVDFYGKDETPELVGDTLRLNDSLSYVVGSADRRNQFASQNPNFSETVLGQLGLINKYVAEAIETAIEQGGNPRDQASKIKGEDIPTLTNNFVKQALSVRTSDSLEDRLLLHYAATFNRPDLINERGPDFSWQFQAPAALKFLHRYAFPSKYNPSAQGLDDATSRSQDAQQRQKLDKLILLASKGGDGDNPLVFRSNDPELRPLLNELGMNDDDFFDLVFGATQFASLLNREVESYIQSYQKRRQINVSQQQSQHGRRVLINKSHGETPYLVLKGHISSIQTSVGTEGGSYIVTLTGEGLEKPLKRHEVYFEDLLFPDNAIAPHAELTTFYAFLSPPRAILHMINRWAPKQLVFGPPGPFSTILNNALISADIANYRIEQTNRLLDGDDSVLSEKDPISKSLEYTGQVFGKEGYPIRGNIIYSRYNGQPAITEDNARIFVPLNYFDTSRIQEMVRVLDNSYDDPDKEAVINNVHALVSRQSIWENIRAAGGVAEFYELLADETGRILYRLSQEALERTPAPEYTPIIRDVDVLAGGSIFSESDGELVTMVDVRPLQGIGQVSISGIGLIGRGTPEAGFVPLEETGGVPEKTLAPQLFRHGLQTLKIDDIYTGEVEGAQRKAALYQSFYGQPLKEAELKLRLDPSYRIGNTVLVLLQKYRRRSQAPIDLDAMITWMRYLLDPANRDLLEMYIGVDLRLVNKDFYTKTASSAFLPIPHPESYRKFVEDPHKFVAEKFLHTFKYLRSILRGVNVITPDYFPPTLWYFLPGDDEVSNEQYSQFLAWDEHRISDEAIVELYEAVLLSSIVGDSGAARKIPQLFDKHEGIINALKFQTFRATSYYIQSVAHTFQQDARAETTLRLTHGQDNLVILEPQYFTPVGFISLERKMAIGFPSPQQDAYWLEQGVQMSPLQKMFVNQFLEDRQFKRSSFLYQAQSYRNSANYMYYLALQRGF